MQRNLLPSRPAADQIVVNLSTYMMIIQEATTAHRGPIVDLLRSNQLPSEDLDQAKHQFWVALQQNDVVGAIGLELYGQYGLLRSMVVNEAARGQGIAAALVGILESAARARDIDAVFLLTETAASYFGKRGYQEIAREDVPPEVKASTEFSHVCPATARVLVKKINFA